MVSELVTNGLRHGAIESGQRIELSVTLVAGLLRVEVCDPGPGFTPRHARPTRRTERDGGSSSSRDWPTAGG